MGSHPERHREREEVTERRDLTPAGIARRLSWTLREKEREEALREAATRPATKETQK